MARATTKVRIVSAQKFEGENNTRYFKLFYLEEPDGKTEHVGAVISMGIADETADEVFAACANFKPMEEINVEFEIARGGQNKGKTIALHVFPVNSRKAQEPAPVAKQG